MSHCGKQGTAKPDTDTEIVKFPYFTTTYLEVTKASSNKVKSDFLIVVCLEGEGLVNGLSPKAGQAGLLMKEDLLIVPKGTMKVLSSHI